MRSAGKPAADDPGSQGTEAFHSEGARTGRLLRTASGGSHASGGAAWRQGYVAQSGAHSVRSW